MRGIELFVSCCVLLVAGTAGAQPWSEPIPGPATDLYPGERVYRWTFYVPVVTIERQEIVVQGPNAIVRSRRFEYDTPGIRYERRKLWEAPDFYCKYPDLRLPNECGVRWHNVYADLPQLTMRREHIDADVVEWTAGEHRIRIDVPRWTWIPRTLTLVVPTLETEPMPERPWARGDGPLLAEVSIERARTKLDAGQAEALKAIDEAAGALGAGIAALEAQGADPSKASAGDGRLVDLYAARQALASEKAAQVARYAQIHAELESAAKTSTAAR